MCITKKTRDENVSILPVATRAPRDLKGTFTGFVPLLFAALIALAFGLMLFAKICMIAVCVTVVSKH